MKFLEWIRQHREKAELKAFAREHGHKSIEGLWAEIRHDEALAKIRDETGREPECRSPKKTPERDRERGR
jgi:hypothetical protein